MNVRVISPMGINTTFKWSRVEVHCYDASNISKPMAFRKLVFENKSIEEITDILELAGVRIDVIANTIKGYELKLFVEVRERGKSYEVEKILKNPEVWEFHDIMGVL